ncbi:probable methyltransferase PMT26 [Humulus lupulus]|uniref:probable methyltransferase PMT26 n=1 Tax=Humulus lupulus TaxID=3486 RepID=UPI002B405BD4|nr:probable methyltransferase PMT26 [Humulus lupulus]
MDDLMPVPEETRLHFTPLNEENGESEKHQDAKVEGDQKSSSGFIEKILPKLVSGKEDQEVDKDDEKRGGLITHLISNLVSPSSPKGGEFTAQKDETPNGDSKSEKEGQEVDKDDERKGGLITDFISNLVSPSSPKTGEFSAQKGESPNGVSKSEDENGIREKKTDGEKENGGGGSGGGIIETIVSRFPTSIPDDVVPTPDEACILINSLVKD